MSTGHTTGTAEDTSRSWQSRAPRRHSAPTAGPGPGICSRGPPGPAWWLPGERRPCSCTDQEWPAPGCGALRGSQPPRWREQEGCDCSGLYYSKWKKKKARKLYSIFPVKVTKSTQNKKETKRAGGRYERRPASGPALRLAPRVPLLTWGSGRRFLSRPSQPEAPVFTLALMGAV